MRIIVCGGRDFSDCEFLWDCLDSIHNKTPITCLIHGDAPGADRMAGKWAAGAEIPMLAFPANWLAHSRSAGPIRNRQMIDEASPDLVVAMPGGRGTANMISQAREAGIPVREF